MNRYALPGCLILFLAGCGGAESPPAAVPTGEPPPATVGPDPRDGESGRAVYERVCAECHDTGQGGAPVTGEPAGWSDRSPLWQAVLYEHAETGYLDMPAKGGHPELTEQQVEAAAEYMLNRTFAERRDDPR